MYIETLVDVSWALLFRRSQAESFDLRTQRLVDSYDKNQILGRTSGRSSKLLIYIKRKSDDPVDQICSKKSDRVIVQLMDYFGMIRSSSESVGYR